MKQNSKIFIKYFVAWMIIIIIFSAGIGYFSYWTAKKSSQWERLNDLMDIVDAKYIHILDILFQEKKNAALLAENNFMRDNLLEYYQNKNDLSAINDYLYKIQNNSELLEHSQKIEKNKGIGISEVFERQVKWYLYRLDERLYRYDEISILDNNGKIIASSQKYLINKNLSADEFFTRGKNEIFVKDFFEDYGGNIRMGFGAPIKNGNDLLGVVVIKMNYKIFNDLMTGDIGNQIGGKLFLAGLDPEEDFYLVRKDGMMVTQSIKLLGQKNTVLQQEVNTLPVQRCLDENNPIREAQEVYVNYLGEQVGGASMCVFEMKWTIVGEKNINLITGAEKIRKYAYNLSISATAFLSILGLIYTLMIIKNIQPTINHE